MAVPLAGVPIRLLPQRSKPLRVDEEEPTLRDLPTFNGERAAKLGRSAFAIAAFQQFVLGREGIKPATGRLFANQPVQSAVSEREHGAPYVL